ALLAVDEREHVALQSAMVTREPPDAGIAPAAAGLLGELLDLDHAAADAAADVEALDGLELRLPAAYIRTSVAGDEGQGRDVITGDGAAGLGEVPLLFLDARITRADALIDRRATESIPDTIDHQDRRASVRWRRVAPRAARRCHYQGAQPRA